VGAAGRLWTAAQGPHDGTARYPRNPQDRGDHFCKQSRRTVPRTNEDKRRAVMKMLQDAEWSKKSNREITHR
jgi:hypothetical protein